MVFDNVPETNGGESLEYQRVELQPYSKPTAESGSLENFIRSCFEEILKALSIFNSDDHVDRIHDQDDQIDPMSGSFLSRSINPTMEMQKCPAPIAQRIRRSIDPIDYPNTDVIHPLRTIRGEYARIKRSSEGKLRSLRQQMARCARDTAGHCEDIQIKYMALVKEINAKLEKFASDILAENGRSKLDNEDEAKELDYAKQMERIKDREREIEHEKQEMSRHFTKFIEEQKNKEKELDERIMKMEKDRLEYDTKFTKADEPLIVLDPIQQPASTKSMDSTHMPVKPISLQTDKLIVKQIIPIQTHSKAIATTNNPNEHIHQSDIPILKPPDHNLLKISVNNAQENQIGKIFFGDGFYYASPNDKPTFHHDEIVEKDHHEFFQNHQLNIEAIRQWQARIMPDQSSSVQNTFQNPQQSQQQPSQQQQQQGGNNQFHNNQQQQTVDQTRFQPIQNQQQQIQPQQQSQLPSVTPLKTGDSFGNNGPSGPFMSLCDQMARQNSNFQSKSQNVQPSFSTVQDFSGANRQNIPLTGETSTSSSQIMFNPGFSFSPTPICFYPAPATPQYYRVQQPGNAHMWAVQPQPQILVPGNRFHPTG